MRTSVPLRQLHLEGFPPGLCEIEAIGLIQHEPSRQTPLVQVQMACGLDRGIRERTVIAVSAGLFPRLIVGDRYLDGVRIQERSSGLRVTLQVDVNPSTISLRRWFEPLRRGRYILPTFIRPLETALGNAYVVVLSRSADDEYGDLVIPCAEIARAYFAQSSAVWLLMLSGAFVSPPDLRLYDPDRSKCVNRSGIIHLGKEVPDVAAKQVARLAFDPIGKQMAQGFVARAAAAALASTAFPIILKPPFEGLATWTLIGEPIGTDGEKRFLVNRLLRCSASLPFDDLVSYRDNPGSGSSDNPSRSELMSGPRHSSNLTISIASYEDPIGGVLGATVLDPEQALITQPISHIIEHRVNPLGRRTIKKNADVVERRAFRPLRRSVGLPGGEKLRALRLASTALTPTVAGGFGSFEYADRLIRALRLADSDFIVDFFCTKRFPVKRKRRSWSILTRGRYRLPRCASIIRLRFGKYTFVIIESQRRHSKEQIATLVVLGLPTETELTRILEALVRGKGRPQESQWRELELGALAYRLVRHPSRSLENAAEVHARRVVRLLRSTVSSRERVRFMPFKRTNTPAENNRVSNKGLI